MLFTFQDTENEVKNALEIALHLIVLLAISTGVTFVVAAFGWPSALSIIVCMLMGFAYGHLIIAPRLIA